MCEAPETYSIAPRARGEDAGVPWAVQPSAAALRSSTRCCETEPGLLLLAKSASIEAYTFVVVVAPGASDRWSPHAPVRASKAARSYRLLLITCCVSCLAYILVTAPLLSAGRCLMQKLPIITLQSRQGIPVQFLAPVLTPLAAPDREC